MKIQIDFLKRLGNTSEGPNWKDGEEEEVVLGHPLDPENMDENAWNARFGENEEIGVEYVLFFAYGAIIRTKGVIENVRDRMKFYWIAPVFYGVAVLFWFLLAMFTGKIASFFLFFGPFSSAKVRDYGSVRFFSFLLARNGQKNCVKNQK